jgi:hypothetical protein
MIKGIRAIVHENASVREALQVFNENKKSPSTQRIENPIHA